MEKYLEAEDLDAYNLELQASSALRLILKVCRRLCDAAAASMVTLV